MNDTLRTRRQMLRLAFSCLLLVLGFIATIMAASNSERISNTLHIATLKINDSLGGKEAQRLLEQSSELKDFPAFVLWQQGGLAIVQNPTLNRAAETQVVVVEGDASLLVTGAYLPEQTPHLSDITNSSEVIENSARQDFFIADAQDDIGTKRLCVLDKATTINLFGDDDAVGYSVRLGDNSLTIAGVVDCERPILLTRPHDNINFDMITIFNDTNWSSAALCDRINVSLGIQTSLLEYSNLYYITRICYLIPLLVLFCTYIGFLIRQLLSKTSTLRQLVLWSALALLSVTLFFILFAQMLETPKDAFPSRWADFSLWQQIASSKAAALRFVFDTVTPAPLAFVFDNFFTALSFSLLSLMLFLFAIWLLSHTRFFIFKHGNSKSTTKEINTSYRGTHIKRLRLTHHQYDRLFRRRRRSSQPTLQSKPDSCLQERCAYDTPNIRLR